MVCEDISSYPHGLFACNISSNSSWISDVIYSILSVQRKHFLRISRKFFRNIIVMFIARSNLQSHNSLLPVYSGYSLKVLFVFVYCGKVKYGIEYALTWWDPPHKKHHAWPHRGISTVVLHPVSSRWLCFDILIPLCLSYASFSYSCFGKWRYYVPTCIMFLHVYVRSVFYLHAKRNLMFMLNWLK